MNAPPEKESARPLARDEHAEIATPARDPQASAPVARTFGVASSANSRVRALRGANGKVVAR